MWSRNLWRAVAIIGTVCVVALALASLVYGTAPLTGGLPVVAIYLSLIVLLRYLMVRRNVFSPASRLTFGDPRVMEISEQFLYYESDGGIQSRLPWPYVVKAERRGSFTLLFLNKINHLVLPDDAFETAADRQAVWALLRQRGLLATAPN